jgi:hypothetical protein
MGYGWKLLKVYAATLLAGDGLDPIRHIHTSQLIQILPQNII